MDIFDIRYLIPHNNCGAATKPRVLLFDMGASVGFQGVPGGIYARMPPNGGGLAPSLPLFYRIYADRCLEPDEVYAWEPNPRVRGPDWWGELPGAIRAKVRFFNDFVVEGEIEQAKGPKGTHPAASFLEILETVAKASPEDFVVVKVDIDTSAIELSIVEAIAEGRRGYARQTLVVYTIFVVSPNHKKRTLLRRWPSHPAARAAARASS